MLSDLSSAFVEAGRRWWAHDPGRLGAALAYYTVFSLGPLLLIVIAIAGLALGRAAVEGEIVEWLTGYIGPTGAKAVEGMLASAADLGAGLSALLLGAATLIVSAVLVVVQLKRAFDTIWEVQPDPNASWWSVVRHYCLALTGILVAGLFVLVSIVASTVLTSIAAYLANYVALPLVAAVDFAISLVVIGALFAGMFKWLPDTDVDWRDVWPAALVTTVLFLIGKWAISWWIGRQGFESTYGAAASLVVLLVWVYYASQIVFFGAELSRVWSERHGSRKSRMLTGELHGRRPGKYLH